MSLTILLLVLALAYVVWTLRRARPEILPEALRAALKAGTAVLVDVREPAEWTAGTARDAVLLPLSDLRGSRRQWTPFLDESRGKQLFLYCQSGTRSAMAAGLLRVPVQSPGGRDLMAVLPSPFPSCFHHTRDLTFRSSIVRGPSHDDKALLTLRFTLA